MKPKEHIFFKIKSNVNKLYNCETDYFPCISMWTDCLQKCGFALLVCDVRTTVHRMTKNLHRFSTFCRNGSLNSNASIKALNFAKTSSIKVFHWYHLKLQVFCKLAWHVYVKIFPVPKPEFSWLVQRLFWDKAKYVPKKMLYYYLSTPHIFQTFCRLIFSLK